MSRLAEIQAKREELLRVAEALGAERLAVFGSVARGEDRPDSDVDLILHFTHGNWVDLLEEAKVAFEACLGVDVDVAEWAYVKDRDGHISAEAIYL